MALVHATNHQKRGVCSHWPLPNREQLTTHTLNIKWLQTINIYLVVTNIKYPVVSHLPIFKCRAAPTPSCDSIPSKWCHEHVVNVNMIRYALWHFLHCVFDKCYKCKRVSYWLAKMVAGLLAFQQRILMLPLNFKVMSLRSSAGLSSS